MSDGDKDPMLLAFAPAMAKLAGQAPLFLALLALTAAAQQTEPAELHWDSHSWQELSWKQSISRRDLPLPEKKRLIDAIVDLVRVQGEGVSQKQLRETASETRITFSDLNGDGKKEVIAQGGGEKSDCSPTGNCPFWVFRRKGNGYEVILSADSKQTFTIQPTETNGFHDLVLGMHGSAFEAGLTLYKFNGSEYENVACYDATWEVRDERGEFHHLKEPRITPCSNQSK